MKGFTIPCSECKEILIRYANFKGEGSFELKCKHCSTLQKVILKNEPKIQVIKVIAVVMLLLAVAGFVATLGGSNIRVAEIEIAE